MSGEALDLDALNRLLGTGVSLLRYVLEADGVRFNVTLSLVDRTGSKRELVCRDVQHLELIPEGDALTKSMRLAVEDLRGESLDRTHFSLEELDRDTLFLHCAALEMEGLNLDGNLSGR